MLGRRQFLAAAALALPRSCRRSVPAVSTCRSRVRSALPVPATMRAPLHPDSLPRFVDRLPIPEVLRPEGLRVDPEEPARQIAHYRVAMRESEIRVHRDVPPTRMWTYAGTTPGPTIEARSGSAIVVEWRNELPNRHFLPIDHGLCGAEPGRPEVRTVVHVHGSRVPSQSDGHPEDWFTPGHGAVYRYPNRQEATTLWYHDHAMGIERLNQYAGLFGVFLVRDELEQSLPLPRDEYEIPLVLSDRLLYADGQLRYPDSGVAESPWVSEVNGDALLVNGKLYPYLDVEPGLYRFRLVNASNSRFYYLSFSDGRSFHQIGTDQGLLAAPVTIDMVTLAPAERADVLVDLRNATGKTIVLKNQAFELVQLRVGSRTGQQRVDVPSALRPIAPIPESASVRTRTLTLNEYEDPKTHAMLMLLNATRWHQPVTERPTLGSVEIWDLVNLTEDTHPVHLHLVRFQVVHRQRFDADEYLTTGKMTVLGAPVRPAANEAGWKDTVRADAGMITRIIVRFDGYAGRYVWHCHVLEHAANEMMRPFEVVA
jgi:spore coat protein A